MSVIMAPQNSMVAAVAVCMIVGGFLNGIEPAYRTLTTPMKHVFGQSTAIAAPSSVLLMSYTGRRLCDYTCCLMGTDLFSTMYPSVHVSVRLHVCT